MTAADLVFRDFDLADAALVIELWQECGLTRPWNDPLEDIERKLTDRNGAFWVVCHGSAVIASVMIGYDGHRGTINYLAIEPTFQRSGVGAELMRRAEAFLVSIGCPKVSFCVRKDNRAVLSFYTGLGYAAEDIHFLGKRLILDR